MPSNSYYEEKSIHTSMNVIAFDVSKNELVGVRTNQSAAIKEQFTLENTQPTITEFLQETKQKYPHVIIASEATAEYHRTLALECLKYDIPFRLLNPIITKQFTKATVRKKKTDLSDAFIIAKCILQGEGTLVTPQSFDPAKTIDRTSYKLYELYSAIHRIQRRFSDTLPKEELVANELQTIRNVFEKSIARIRKNVRSRIDQPLHELLCSIPGIGPTLANTFITEIGNIQRFLDPKSLIAYAGLDPKVKQSGISLKRNTHLTKRGSPYLRRAAYIAASVAQRCDPELKTYYEKKRNEGKRYREATIANARHMLNRVYAVWKRGTPYIKKSTVNA